MDVSVTDVRVICDEKPILPSRWRATLRLSHRAGFLKKREKWRTRRAFDLQARFFMERFTDHQYGEVYTALFQNGKIDDEKIGPWKAPYHVTQAFLEIIARLGGTL
jgi:mannose/cellobiose epimerase-like protein (N-acyl-D-glucosamine 2-epimerase family)